MTRGKRGIGVMRSHLFRWHLPHRAGLTISVLAACLVAGCGIAQAMKERGASVSNTTTATHEKGMAVDLVAQKFLNPDPSGQSLSLLVRFYQLRNEKAFADLDYIQFQRDGLNLLKADLLATKDVVLRPGVTTSISEPMNEAAQVVGVVAFFREPVQDRSWKLVIANELWRQRNPVRIEVRGNELRLANTHK